jgi:glycine/D-amino acid oxidase-like deaminating enzyme
MNVKTPNGKNPQKNPQSSFIVNPNVNPNVNPKGMADVIVVGSGITGSALSYELATQGVQVLLIDRDPEAAPNATRYSYGGISYWAGTTETTRQLCQEGLAIHRSLSQILDSPTEFRELPLLSTIALDQDPQTIKSTFQKFSLSPEYLTPQEAKTLEPLLNPNAIAAALLMPYAQIHPQQTALAYQNAFLRLGGKIQADRIHRIETCLTGVTVLGSQHHYQSAQVVICAGGEARSLLHQSGYRLRQYFSHAESMEIAAQELRQRSLQMQTVVMPAQIRRFQLEAEAGAIDRAWSEAENTELENTELENTELENTERKHTEPIIPAILDSGALQFTDGSVRFGQISRTYPSLRPVRDRAQSEQWMRTAIGEILPDLAPLPATWVTCTVAFSADHLPIVGAITPDHRIQIFSGFSNPMALFPATARRFAQQLAQQRLDPILTPFSPDRFCLEA